ncbi:porin [Cupriavidus necator]|nr:porin [Cupriavidus necator]MDX6008737.1 porin [Cupriavidus necator]
MKRSMVALAVLAAFSGTAMAQAGLTLYGVADINVEYVNHVGKVPSAANQFNPGPANDAWRINSGGVAGSRWGLRGEEDLGNGLKSVFVLESGFNLDNGTLAMSGRLFDRQAFVGVQSASYGRLTFGRQYTSIMYALANFTPMAFASQYDPIVAQIGPNFREDNTVAYSGTFGPVTAMAHWSFGTGVALPQPAANGVAVGGNGEVPGQFRRDAGYGVGLNYFAGKLGLAAAYDQFNPSIGTAGGTISSGAYKKAAVAASYAIGPVTVMGGYRWGQNKDANGILLQRDDLYSLGANYQVTSALDLSVAYNYQDLKNFLGSTRLANPWQVALRANYALSKRTSLYLTTAFAKNAGLMLDSGPTAYVTSLFLGNSYALAGGQSTMLGAALGIRHTF